MQNLIIHSYLPYTMRYLPTPLELNDVNLKSQMKSTTAITYKIHQLARNSVNPCARPRNGLSSHLNACESNQELNRDI